MSADDAKRSQVGEDDTIAIRLVQWLSTLTLRPKNKLETFICQDALREGQDPDDALRLHRALHECDMPKEIFERLRGLTGWHDEAARLTESFLIVRKIAQPNDTKAAAEAIGKFVTEQLSTGNLRALRVLNEGMMNRIHGKPFVSKGGRGSADQSRANLGFVAVMFFALKKLGLKEPSQTDVRRALEVAGRPISKSQMSKIFDELKLKSYASDARQNDTEAGKRRRGKG